MLKRPLRVGERVRVLWDTDGEMRDYREGLVVGHDPDTFGYKLLMDFDGEEYDCGFGFLLSPVEVDPLPQGRSLLVDLAS